MSGRIRTIKPELLEDAVTAGLTDTAFRLFIGCILLADDYGNFRAETEFLRGQVWWKTKPAILLEEAVREVETKGPDPESGSLVFFYMVKGQRYGAIRGWRKHQRVDHPGKPRVPGPPELPASAGAPPASIPPAPVSSGFFATTETLASLSRERREGLAPDLRPPTSDPDLRPGSADLACPPAHESTYARPAPVPRSSSVRMTVSTPPPDGIPITEELRDRFAMAFLPVPTEQNVAQFLRNARKKGWCFHDWIAALEDWMANQPRFDRENSARELARAAPRASSNTSIRQGRAGPDEYDSRVEEAAAVWRGSAVASSP